MAPCVEQCPMSHIPIQKKSSPMFLTSLGLALSDSTLANEISPEAL